MPIFIQTLYFFIFDLKFFLQVQIWLLDILKKWFERWKMRLLLFFKNLSFLGSFFQISLITHCGNGSFKTKEAYICRNQLFIPAG